MQLKLLIVVDVDDQLIALLIAPDTRRHRKLTGGGNYVEVVVALIVNARVDVSVGADGDDVAAHGITPGTAGFCSYLLFICAGPTELARYLMGSAN